jgi:hypothetical protein
MTMLHFNLWRFSSRVFRGVDSMPTARRPRAPRIGNLTHLARDDHEDPGWYKQPSGTPAREWIGALPATARGRPRCQHDHRAQTTHTTSTEELG